MKKTLAVLLCVLLLLGAMPVAAADQASDANGHATVKLSAAGPDVNGIVEVTAMITTEDWITAYALAVTYDPAFVTPKMDADGAYSKTSKKNTTYYGVSAVGVDNADFFTNNLNTNTFTENGKSVFLATDVNTDYFTDPEETPSFGVKFYFEATEAALTTGGKADFTLAVGNTTDGTNTTMFSISWEGDVEGEGVIVALGDTVSTSVSFPISSVALTGALTTPVKSGTDASAFTATGADVTVSWEPALTGGQFMGNTVYTATVKVTPAEGAVFADNVSVTATGLTFTKQADGSYQATKTFDKTEDKWVPTISEESAGTATYGQSLADVSINGTAAYGGATVEGTFSWADSTASVGDVKAIPASFAAKFTPANTADYAVVEFQLPVIVEPKTVTATVEIDPSSYTYTGSPITPDSIIVKDGTTAIPDSEYELTINANQNVGTATVTVADKSGGNYIVSGSATFSITKADATCTAPAAISDLTYDGTAQELVEAGTAAGGTLQYKLGDGTYSEDLPKATDAGEYTVYYKVIGDENHEDSDEQSVTVSIDRATLNIRALDTSVAYGDILPEPHAEYDGFVGDEDEDVLEGTAVFDFSDYEPGTPAGEYEITVSGLTAKNYEINFESGTLTVKSRDVYDLTFEGLTEQEYTGEPIKPAFTLKDDDDNTISPDEYEVEYTNNTNVGTAAITVTDKVGGNYTVSGSTTFAITAHTLVDAYATVTATQNVVVGIGSFVEPTFTDTRTGKPIAGTVEYAGLSAAELKEELAGMTKGAACMYRWYFTPTDANYTGILTDCIYFSLVDIEFLVGGAAATADTMVEVKKASPVYGDSWGDILGSIAAITAKVDADTDSTASNFTLKVDGAAFDAAAIPTAGDHSVKVVYNGTIGGKSYTDVAVAEKTITVSPKTLTVTAGTAAATKEYDGTTAVTPDGALALEGVVGSDVVTLKYTSCAFADQKAGEGKEVKFDGLSLDGAAKANYTLADTDFSITGAITPKALTVTGTTLKEKTYDGLAAGELDNAGTLDGVCSGDGDFVTLDASEANVTFASVNAGEGIAVTVSGLKLNGAAKDSYTLTQPEGLTGKIVKANYDGEKFASGEAKYGNSETLDLSAYIAEGASVGALSVTDAGSALDGNVTVTDGALSFAFKNDDTLIGETIIVTVPVENATNYNNYGLTVTLTVLDKLPQTLTAENMEITYGDAGKAAAVTGAQTALTYVSSDETVLTVDASGVITTVKPGTAQITIKAEASDDYAAAEKTITVTVGKKAITVIALDRYVAFGGTIPELSAPALGVDYSASGLVGSDTLTVTAKYQKDGADAEPVSTEVGSYDIVLTAENDKYEITVQNGKLNIYVPYVPPVEPPVTEPADSVIEISDSAENGEVKATVSVKDAQEAVEAAKNGGDEALTVKVEAEDAESAEVTLPAAAIEAAAEAGLGIRLETAAGEVTLSEEAVKALADKIGAATLTVETADGVTKVDVQVNGETADVDVKVSLPAGNGTALSLVAADGTEKAIGKSLVRDGEAVATVPAGSALKVTDNALEFDDVNDGDWYEGAVDFVTAHELFKGMDENVFAPDLPMTRAMMVTVLYRLEGEPNFDVDNAFTDVHVGDWYEDAVLWAEANDITNGMDDGSFGADLDVTREQVATFLYRYAKYLGMDVTVESPAAYNGAEQTSDWAVNAMQWAIANGIFEGDENGAMDPGAGATRAQVAALLKRLVELIVK